MALLEFHLEVQLYVSYIYMYIFHKYQSKNFCERTYDFIGAFSKQRLRLRHLIRQCLSAKKTHIFKITERVQARAQAEGLKRPQL